MNNNTNKAICDKCNKEFTLKLKKTTKDDLEITYIKCPKCKEKYIVSVTDEELRKNIEKAKELRKKMLSSSEYKKIATDYYVINSKNIIRAKQLKERYLGGK